MIKDIRFDEFLTLRDDCVLIDVRSPGEFAKGHIPGAVNIPLFTNEERAAVGTIYTKEGEDAAISLGESFAVPKIKWYLEETDKAAVKQGILVYCFRGGLRSDRFCELLDDHGISTLRLSGGYKAFRRGAAACIAKRRNLKVLGGRTGSGKTDILDELTDLGQNVIDLEGLACHKGSAFGSIGMKDQPSTEQFENLLFEELYSINEEDSVWIEDESRNIGSVFLPETFFHALWESPLYVINLPNKFRVDRLCRDYTSAGMEPLINSLEKIRKRLGGDKTNNALSALKEGNIGKAAAIALEYYDKCYDYSITHNSRNVVLTIDLTDDNPGETAKKLINS